MTKPTWDAQVAGWSANRFSTWYTDDICGTVQYYKRTSHGGKCWEWMIEDLGWSNETGFTVLATGFASSHRKAMMACDAAYKKLKKAKP